MLTTAAEPLNRRSRRLTVAVATYNRLDSLKRTLASIAAGTWMDHEVAVVDGGSTDGTIKFLQSQAAVIPILQGKLVGTARAYNAAWSALDSEYTCWLSDDTELVPGTLDTAVAILEGDRGVGMVGLKMKDTVGPWVNEPYLGGFSEFGVLNCNHGVLSMRTLRALGGFNTDYRSYMVDPDLTASVLCTGKAVVMTRAVGVLHHREYVAAGVQQRMTAERGGIDNAAIYRRKFAFLEHRDSTEWTGVREQLRARLFDRLFPESDPARARFGLNRRDVRNLLRGRFLRLSDPLESLGRAYHMIQRIPGPILRRRDNPYRHLLPG